MMMITEIYGHEVPLAYLNAKPRATPNRLSVAGLLVDLPMSNRHKIVGVDMSISSLWDI